MIRLWIALLPDLRAFPEQERSATLARARETPLDAIELAAMIVALVGVAALTKGVAPVPGMAGQFLSVVSNFVVALPLLAVALGPFHLRRLRRGLRQLRDARRRSG